MQQSIQNRAALVATLLAPLAHAGAEPLAQAPSEAPTAPAVASWYVELAGHRYADTLGGTVELLKAANALIEEPTNASLAAAKEAWVEAHATYSHCEVFRFGNPNVDAWEGHVNAWPMDEGLIDYVASGYVHHEGNPHARADIIGKGHLPITDEIIEEYASGADPKAAPISDITDIESNVTTGYHAVEFLLWGQDLSADGPGARPVTDFARTEDCTGGSCARRCDYLAAASRLLVADLRKMIIDWNPESKLYGARFLSLEPAEQLDRILVGLGSLSFAEVASERIKVALLTADQEEEQSCFSDTTLVAIEQNLRGVENTYLGRHTMRDGTVQSGPSVGALVASVDPELDAAIRRQLRETVAFAAALVEAGAPFDALIRFENTEGRAALKELMALLAAQTESLEAARGLIPQLVRIGG